MPFNDPDIIDTYSYSWIKNNNPKPEEVHIAFGMVKYELIAPRFLKRNDNGTYDIVSLDNVDDQIPRGVLLVQMVGPETMQIESVTEKRAEEVVGFSGTQRVYVRNPDYE